MFTYPDIDPVAFGIGPFKVHWYGLMYLVGFVGGWWLALYRARRPGSGWTKEQVTDLLFYVAIGVVAGGRIGYILFYNFGYFLADPLILFKVWQGGMSFHGGLLGVIAAVWLFGRKMHRTFFNVADFLVPVGPLGLGAVRIGNFINGELWGRPTDVPWAMVFPHVDAQPRHPSMLYEALMEGLILGIILWIYSSKPRPTMAVSGLFLVCYGCFRWVIEFAREPDAHIGYLAFGWLTMGQVLTTPMIIAGLVMLWMAYSRQPALQRSSNAAQ